MRCERCGAEATSTGPRGQRLCDLHYNPNMAAAPVLISTGMSADLFSAMIVPDDVADAAEGTVHGGQVPVVGRRGRLWQRMRQRLDANAPAVEVACAFCGELVEYTDLDPIALGIIERWRPYEERPDTTFYAHRGCFAARLDPDTREIFEEDQPSG